MIRLEHHSNSGPDLASTIQASTRADFSWRVMPGKLSLVFQKLQRAQEGNRSIAPAGCLHAGGRRLVLAANVLEVNALPSLPSLSG